MTMKLLSADDFRAAAKDGETPTGTVFRFSTADPQTVDGAARTKRFVFSDATVDHSNDSIDQKGWDLSVFKSNPVALFSHMSWEPPIGRASNVSVVNDKLVGDIEFAEAEVYPLADTVFRLVDAGFLRAVSVGFLPKEWSFTNDKNRPYGIDFKKQQLLEISCCSLPANPSALIEARSMGINTAPLQEWAEKVLDSGDTVFLPRKDLEALRSQASETPAPRFYIQTPKSLAAEAAERLRDSVKSWIADPSEVLILPEGVTLLSVGEKGPEQFAPIAAGQSLTELRASIEAVRAEIATEERSEIESKAGRRVSAATKAKLQEAMGHHDAAMASHAEMAKCVKALMDDPVVEPDDGSDGEPDDDETGDPNAQPPGSVVLESDEHLTPEERRLKEAREFKASLQTD